VVGARTAVSSLLRTPRPDLTLLNDDDTDYVIVRLDPHSLETVLLSVRSEPALPVLSALRKQAEWLITRFAAPYKAAEARTLLETAVAAVPGLALGA
jgi:hypothetical protein